MQSRRGNDKRRCPHSQGDNLQTQQHHRGSLVTARNCSRLDTISLASLCFPLK